MAGAVVANTYQRWQGLEKSHFFEKRDLTPFWVSDGRNGMLRNASWICRSLMMGVAFTTSAVSAGDWPQFRGTNRDGKSDETGLWNRMIAGTLQPLWIGDGCGAGYGSPSVLEDQIFLTGNVGAQQAVQCFSATDGSLRWSTVIAETLPDHNYEGSRCTPTVIGDVVFAVGSNGCIACLEASTGNLLWKREYSDWQGRMMSVWGFSESPLVVGDKVICTPGGPESCVVALDSKSGEQVWVAKWPADAALENPNTGSALAQGAGYASAMHAEFDGVSQVIQLVGPGVMGIASETGEVLWTYSGTANGTANIPTVLIDDDSVITSTAYNTGTARIKIGNDQDHWSVTEEYFLPAKTLQNKHGGMVLIDDHVYCGHGNGQGRPICVHAETGETVWGPVRSQAGGKGEASVIYADGHILSRYENGIVELFAATPDGYRSVAALRPAYQEGSSWAHPVVANGRLYLREQDKLLCYVLN